MPLIYPELPGLTFDWGRRPSFENQTESHVSGREVRITYYPNQPIWNWDLIYGGLRDFPCGTIPSELKRLEGFFLSVGASLDSFLFRDPDDWQVFAQFIATTDGTACFALVRTFGDAGYGATETETVGYVNLSEPFNVYLNGVLQSPSSYTVTQATPGFYCFITFNAAPAAGLSLTVDMSYYFWARFSEDYADFEEFAHLFWLLRTIKLRSQRMAIIGDCLPLTPMPPAPPPPPPPPPPPACPCPGPDSSSSGGGWDVSVITPATKTYSGSGNSIAQVTGLTGSGFLSYIFRGATSHNSGRYYFELHSGSGLVGERQIGLINSSYPVTSNSVQLGAAGSLGAGFFFLSALNLFVNGTGRIIIGENGAIADNSWVGVAIDFDTGLIWFTNHFGSWNVNSYDDPTCEVGGHRIILPAGAYFIAVAHVLSAVPGMPWTIVTDSNKAIARGYLPRCFVWW